MLIEWTKIPDFMQCQEVKEYYDIISKRKKSLFFKRLFDIIIAVICILVLFIPMIIISIMIKLDSEGPIFFRQERITSYGKPFYIIKFRTMVNNANKIGSSVTVSGDSRITKVGHKLRDLRLDELPQLFNVLIGEMSFVGTRPEVKKYVEKYNNEMLATLLLPAGITSEASIRYKDEANLLSVADDVDMVYIEKILPDKMKYNLDSLREFSFFKDILTMFHTIFAVFGKDYK